MTLSDLTSKYPNDPTLWAIGEAIRYHGISDLEAALIALDAVLASNQVLLKRVTELERTASITYIIPLAVAGDLKHALDKTTE